MTTWPRLFLWLSLCVLVGLGLFLVSYLFAHFDRSSAYVSSVFRPVARPIGGVLTQAERSWSDAKLQLICLVVTNLVGVVASMCFLFSRARSNNEREALKQV